MIFWNSKKLDFARKNLHGRAKCSAQKNEKKHWVQQMNLEKGLTGSQLVVLHGKDNENCMIFTVKL